MNDRIDRHLPVADLVLQHGEGRKRGHWRPDMPRELNCEQLLFLVWINLQLTVGKACISWKCGGLRLNCFAVRGLRHQYMSPLQHYVVQLESHLVPYSVIELQDVQLFSGEIEYT